MRLAGKVAAITGGSSGIGRAIALTFAREGARVVVGDVRPDPREGGRDTVSLINEQRQGGAAFLKTDVSCPQQTEALAADAVKRFGRLDVMVNVAGINVFKRAVDTTPEEFNRVIAVNLGGVFLCSTAAVRRMIAQGGGGSVVNIASNLGLVGCAEMAAYCASKAGVIGLTRTMAIEYGPHGIRCNALCPGATKTEINREFRSRPDIVKSWADKTPLRFADGEFLGEPQDIANAALFLASDESRYMTGACLVIDGGWNAV